VQSVSQIRRDHAQGSLEFASICEPIVARTTIPDWFPDLEMHGPFRRTRLDGSLVYFNRAGKIEWVRRPLQGRALRAGDRTVVVGDAR